MISASISSLLLLFPLVVGYIHRKDLLRSELNLVYQYMFVFLLYEIVGWIFALNGWRNHFLNNTITYSDLLFWGYYFYTRLSLPLLKKAVLFLGSLALVSITYFYWYQHDFNTINSYTHSIVNLSIMLFSLSFFYQLFYDSTTENVLTYPHFWISVGVLIYFSGVVYVHLYAKYIYDSKDTNIVSYWNIIHYLLIIHRIALGIAFLLHKHGTNASNTT